MNVSFLGFFYDFSVHIYDYYINYFYRYIIHNYYINTIIFKVVLLIQLLNSKYMIVLLKIYLIEDKY